MVEDKKQKNIFLNLYDKHYRLLMIFSLAILLFALVSIGHKYATTGDFVSKGVTLKGGITLTAHTFENLDSDELENYLRNLYPKADIDVRSVSEAGVSKGFIVEASDITEQELLDSLRSKTTAIDKKDYSMELMGPSLGDSFFNQVLKSIFIAFLFMALVVFLYFGETGKLKWLATILTLIAGFMMFYAQSIVFVIIPIILFIILLWIYIKDSIPSTAIMFCAFSDIIFSLAIFNMLDMKLSTAGVAAFLMLVGYSIDTDILLSVRVLKRKEGTIFERTVDAMKTGITMSLCALASVLTAFFLTQSSVIKEIMFILAIGLAADIVFTWIQNAGILRWHLETKGWK